MRQKDPAITASRPLDAYLYHVSEVDGVSLPTHWEMLEALARRYHHLQNEHQRAAPESGTRRRIEERLFDVPPEHSDGVSATGYGDDRPWFWIAEQNATKGKLHIALKAKSIG